jgi:predicted nucleotide-binding protein
MDWCNIEMMIESEVYMHNHSSKNRRNHLHKEKNVYVIHGHNQVIRDAMYAFLRALGLQPIEREIAVDWTGEAAPFVDRIIDVAFEHAQAVIVLLTAEDKIRLREKFWDEHDKNNEKIFRTQSSQDQIFEVGYAFGKAPTRTILVQIGDVKLFTDIEGRYISNFTGSASDRHTLKNQLKRAGCVVEDKGISWLSAGNFQDNVV